MLRAKRAGLKSGRMPCTAQRAAFPYTAILAQLVEQRFCKSSEQSANADAAHGIAETALPVLPSGLPFSPQLQAILDAWDGLPKHVRDTISTLVQAHAPTK
jgi:hypothetical protein